MYVDKILISGSSKQENVERLQVVLSRLLEASLRLKKERSTRSGPRSSRSVLDDENMDDSPVSAKDIARWTKCDAVLSTVYQFTQECWSATCGMTSNHTKFGKKEFTKQDECVMGTPSGDSTHSSRGHVSGATCGAPGN